MCENGKFIHNPYDGREYYVECGKCDQCKEVKAKKRFSRLMNEKLSCRPSLFVNLTYNHDSVPYIRKSELVEYVANQPVNHRDSLFSENELAVYRGTKVIQRLRYRDFIENGKIPQLRNYDLDDLKFLRHKVAGNFQVCDDKVAVCLLSDFQKFFKRLKRNLFRMGYNGYLSYFYCNEYGTKYSRSHLHALVYYDQGYYSILRRAIVKSWKFCNMSRPFFCNGRKLWPISMAKGAERYISTYINCRVDVSPFLCETRPFKVRYKFSNGFGTDYSEFSLPSLLEKVARGNLQYSRFEIEDGCLTLRQAEIPRYVLSSIWPKFKGYRYLSVDALEQLIEKPSRFLETAARDVKFSDIRRNKVDFLSGEVLHPSIYNLQKYLDYGERQILFKKFTKLREKIPSYLVKDWAFFYPRVWSLYASDMIKQSYDDCVYPTDILEHFNNIKDYVHRRDYVYDDKMIFKPSIKNYFLDDICKELHITDKEQIQISPVKFLRVSTRNRILQKNFNDSIKHHVINNLYYEK